ncbi:MAG: TAT-variant-translocated molybdopterin oxidoreductase [Flavisolibacter sp.]
MSDKKYWQSFAELNNKDHVQRMAQDEFKEELPFEDLDESLINSKTPRRDFLKYLGFSTAAATIAASCKTPVRKAIPYVNRPENLVPGVPKYYASTYVQDGDAIPVVVKVRDGRPIKIEGNELCTFTQGGTSARVQASVLDLYDMYRLRHPARKVGAGFQEIPTFEQLDAQILNTLSGLGGQAVVLLTSTIVSPSSKDIIKEFLSKFPGSRHVQYDAVSYSGMLLANESTQGKREIPAYQFDKAKVIVSLGADFLGTWLAPVEFAYQYSLGRKIDERNPVMSKHYQFESFLSMTGANADERFTHRPSETGLVALALLAAIGGPATTASLSDDQLSKAVQKVAADLKANQGNALVVCGSNDPNIQIVVNAINTALGSYGATISNTVSLNYRQGIDGEMVNLVSQMNAGQVGALLIYGANPAYDFYDAEKFINGLKQVKLAISFNEKMDETTEHCHYSIPAPHYLESWGDAEPRSGYLSFIQPTIYPLFKTRPFQASLLKWSGNNTDYENYFRTYWSGKLGGQQALDKLLQDGVLQNAPTAQVMNTGKSNSSGGGLASAVAALKTAKKGGNDEIIIYQKVFLLSGKQAGNPWLLEMPDPITRATWDNYAIISTAKAKALGIKYESTEYEYYPEKPVIELTVNNKKISLPVLVMPGMNAHTIAVAVGYGRSEMFAKATYGVGKNVFPWARFNGTTVDYQNEVITSDKPIENYKIAQTQIHNSYEGRSEVIKETTMGTFKKYPNQYKEWRADLVKDYAPNTGNYRKEGTLYGDIIQPGLKWGMSVDLNSCIGCGACVVACTAENNVPVVGKNEVLRAHEMHWLRIDRYFVSDKNNPDQLQTVIFQPMLCQHCDNAPCENVCPVAATVHSSEGMNQMAYNRCIGTRYCANNCPYKVRRFNWADYTGSDSFPNNQDQNGVGKLNEVVFQMNDELTRMVLNPDVTTRSRGVMEKCSFCVQRIQSSKLKAKMEDRRLGGDEVQTACAQACPTNAIVFGNANDQSSQVNQMRKDNSQRLFYTLEQIHTLPNVSYLAKIRNTDDIVENEENMGEHGGETKKELIPSQHEPAKEVQ